MQHLSEEQLVLFHYGEIEHRSQVEDHLADCASCRASYQTLRDVLVAVEAAPVPEPGEDYGASVWHKLRPALGPLAEAGELHPIRPGLWRWLFPRWSMAGAMAVLVVAAFLAGRFSTRPTPPIPVKRERILLVAVGDHLERSQMVLAELIHTPGDGLVDISAEQMWAEDLLDSNRLFRQTADVAGEKALASVLEDLERTLIEIAHSPSTLSSRKLEELRSRIESEGILFKVRVVGSELREREEGRDHL